LKDQAIEAVYWNKPEILGELESLSKNELIDLYYAIHSIFKI